MNGGYSSLLRIPQEFFQTFAISLKRKWLRYKPLSFYKRIYNFALIFLKFVGVERVKLIAQGHNCDY